LALTSQTANPWASSRYNGAFQESPVASITTLVTPTSAGRSATTSSERVMVWSVATSCGRLLRLPWPGTRMQQTSSALPMSNAATRATISSV
jgi:hypothetical protein